MTKPKKTPSGVEARKRRRHDGTTYFKYRVRWNDPLTGERKGEEFDTPDEAADFKAHLRLLKRRGVLHELDAGRDLLADFFAQWWTDYAGANLSRNTLLTYQSIWNRHFLPRIGHLQLRELTPPVLVQLRNDLEKDGVGAPTIRKGMAMLQGVLARAVEWGKLPANPAPAVRKPRATRQLAIVVPTVDQVEAIRALMPTPTDAALISVLAYSGPRPQDALALEYRHLGKTVLLYEQKTVHGEVVAGNKTGRPPRTVELLKHLRADLLALRMSSGNPAPSTLVFNRRGEAWADHDWRNWRRRIFQPAADTVMGRPTADQAKANPELAGKRASMTATRPYDLRHLYASLRIAEQRMSLLEIAEELGHSVATLSRDYAHVIADLKGQPPVDPDALIEAARSKSTARLRGAM